MRNLDVHFVNIFSRASNFGLVKIDRGGRVTHFSEKPTGVDLKSMVMVFV